jgi:maleylpyruvate isomerase
VENSSNRRELGRDLAGCAAAHQRLLARVAQLTDEHARQPSLLPDWSVGHVIAHLARNADSHVRMFDAAARGEVAWQYPSAGFRADEIEAGAVLPAGELVADLRTSIERLEHVWATASPATWAGEGLNAQGPVPIDDLPFRRWREAEVHHADLGLGYTPADWPADYVKLELARLTMTWASRRSMGLTELPASATALPPTTRLAWLLGRVEVDGLAPAGVF